MSLTLTQIVDIAAADNEFTMVTPSDDIFYANQQYERLTDVIATIADEVLDKADASHTHSGYAASSHSHSDKADLVDGKVPASQLPSFVDDVLEYTALANFPIAGESGKIYIDQTTNKTYRWSGSAYVEISASLALGETASTAYRGDRGATAYTHSQNGDVHVTAAQKIAWDAKSNFSGSYNDLTNKPTIPSAYTLPAAGSALGGVKTGGDVTISNGTITVNDDSHNHTIANVDGLQTALNAKAASSHNHDSAYMSKDLQFTNDTGGVMLSYLKDDGKNVLDEIVSLSIGFYTIYCQSGVSGNPKTTEAWRYLVHKTGTAVCWVQAYGSIGSVYTNYYDGSSGWRGWKCLWDNSPAPLWTGAMYMTSMNGTPQVVTPSKKLSECQHGWLLLWSDYDPGDGANDADFVTTMIPKRNATGGTWGGKSFLCDIPRYVGSDATDTSTEKRIIKPIYVHDDCIKGSYQNASGDRNDVVLRAVYEY